MSDTYRGDTVGKKLARLYAWRHMCEELGGDKEGTYGYGKPECSIQHPRCRFLYLASREGGDASVLASMGVAPQQQLAVDVDECALAEFSAKWPRIPTVNCDVRQIRRSSHDRFKFIFLDFCSHLSVDLFVTVENVIRGCLRPLGGIIAIAYLRGREKSDVIGDVHAKRAHKSFGGSLHACGDVDERAMTDGRHDLLAHQVNLRLQTSRLFAYSQQVLTYQSRTEDHFGVPMGISIFTVKVLRDDNVSRMGNPALRSRRHADAMHTLLRNASCMATDFSCMWTAEHLREAALYHLIEDGWSSSRVAMALNIDSRTVAAWKAHATMGTYKKAE